MEPSRYGEGDDRKALRIGAAVIGIAVLAIVVLIVVLTTAIRHNARPESIGRSIGQASVAADGKTITVNFEGTPCEAGKVTAVETARLVTLTLRIQAKDKPCVDLAVLDNATVVLHAPLGNRALRDAETGRQVPQSTPTS